MTASLSGSGIVLRPYEPGEVTSMCEAVLESMATVGRWMPWCHPGYAMKDAQAWYERCASAWATEGDREFGIFDGASGDVLGCVGVNQIHPIDRRGNLGYWVRASRERRGIATTAARLAAGYAFADLGLARLEIVVLPDNAASRRVAEKIGARFECIARSRLQVREQPRDAAVYSLLPGDLAG